jgi:hypothetical protein
MITLLLFESGFIMKQIQTKFLTFSLKVAQDSGRFSIIGKGTSTTNGKQEVVVCKMNEKGVFISLIILIKIIIIIPLSPL